MTTVASTSAVLGITLSFRFRYGEAMRSVRPFLLVAPRTIASTVLGFTLSFRFGRGVRMWGGRNDSWGCRSPCRCKNHELQVHFLFVPSIFVALVRIALVRPV